MPAEGFLQRFHDLAEADEEVRCRAAVGIRLDLVKGGRENAEDLQYTIRRLVRGVQSSRACCRQGFSLALSEVLVAFPNDLAGVMESIRTNTELLPGLKNSELKDRLLGRLFAYAAVLQAGCLKPAVLTNSQKKRPERKVLVELGKGLHEIFAMRPYLKAPAARILADAVAQLSSEGLAEMVPELLGPWNLEEKAAAMTGAGTVPDVQTAGLLLELRGVYVQAEQTRKSQEGLKSWPVCIRKDLLTQASGAEALVQAVGSDLAASPLSDGLSWVVGPFCSWLLQMSKQKSLQEQHWHIFHSALFPDGKTTPSGEAQGLRALAEIASQLHEVGLAEATNGSKSSSASSVLASLFSKMPRGLTLLFRALSWQRAHTHPAALFAQSKLVDSVGAPQPAFHGKRKHAVEEAKSPTLPMTDDLRLGILEAVQSQKTFATMNGRFQRMWQQALLAPLSPAGVRQRCTRLLGSLSDEGDNSNPGTRRLCADQLVQLATHGHAPDEVILASLCLLLTESYFEPTAGADNRATFSLNKFRSSVGFDTSSAGDDLRIITLNSAAKTSDAAEDEKADAPHAHRTQWRLKLWSALVGLSRRMSPEQAVKFAASVKEDVTQGGAEPVVRTFAFHGCLADGSLWAMRLHEWWDYITSQEGQVSSKKKRKVQNGSDAAATMRCVIEFDSSATSLRQRCLQSCRKVLSEPDGEFSLPARLRNGLVGLPLVLALSLLESEDEEREVEPDEPEVKEQLETLVELLEEIPTTPTFPEAPKEKRKAVAAFQKRRAESLASFPTIAAELFVNCNGLIKEAARTAWRELGEYIEDETLTSLCASVRDLDPEDDKDDEKEDDNASDGEDPEDVKEEVSASAAAKIARLQKATADLAAQRATEKAEKAEKGVEDDGEDEEDEIMLDGDDVIQHLLDDGGDDEGGLLGSFASSGLQNPEAAGPKPSKWQQRLQMRNADLTRKFREVELLELFTQKCADKRQITVQILHELFECVVAAGRRAMSKDNKEGGEEGDKTQKKRSKATAALQRMERELMQRVAAVVSKALKHVCRGAALIAASKWHTASEWADRARALAKTSAQISSAGQKPAEVSAVLLYWLCSLHRTRAAADAGAEPGEWVLANELLAEAAKDWGSKKDSDKWCQAFLGAFAVRVPEALLRLPWAEHIRNSRNMFTQREQVQFLTNNLLRSLGPDVAGATEFSANFATLCAELLDATLKSAVEGEAQQPGASGQQRQKMRREVLRCLTVLLRVKQKKNNRQHGVPDEKTRRIVKAVTKVRDALPARHGEVFQLCLHVLRSISGPKQKKDTPPNSPKAQMLREAPAEEAAAGETKKAKRAKLNGQKAANGSEGFFGDM